jgi:hypothetical protein
LAAEKRDGRKIFDGTDITGKIVPDSAPRLPPRHPVFDSMLANL